MMIFTDFLVGRVLELARQHSRPDTYRSTLHDILCSYPRSSLVLPCLKLPSP